MYWSLDVKNQMNVLTMSWHVNPFFGAKGTDLECKWCQQEHRDKEAFPQTHVLPNLT